MNTRVAKSVFQIIRKQWILCLGLLILPLIFYYQAIDDDYILDDKIVISENSFVKDGFSGIPAIFTHDSFYGYFKESINVLEGGRYRPLSLVTFAIENQFYGNNPVMNHIINLLLYGATGILIFVLFHTLAMHYGWNDKTWMSIAFMGTLLFIMHPIHTEAVVNIKGRDEILALFFSLLSSIAFISAVYNNKKRWSAYIFGAIAFFLALLSKENAITFLAIIPITLYYISDKIKSSKVYIPAIILLLISLIYLFLRYRILGDTADGSSIQNPLNNPFYGLSTEQSWGTVFYTLCRYLELLIFPHPLSHDYYPYAIPTADFSYPRVWVAIITYTGMLIYALYGLFKRSIPAWTALYFLCTASIISNVFFTVGTTMNERFMYMPSVAFSLLTAYFLYRLRKWIPGLASGLLLVVVGLYGYKIIDRVPDWSSHLELNKSAVANAPNSARSQLFYGTALFKKAQKTENKKEKITIYRKALQHLQKAQTIFVEKGTETTKHFTYSDAVNMKAGAASELYKLGAMDLSTLLKKFKEVLNRKPTNQYTKEFLLYLNRKLGYNPTLLNFYRDLGGRILPWYGKNVSSSYYNYAIQYLEMGLTIAPNDPQLLNSLINIYKKVGNKDMVRKYQKQL